MQAKAQVPVPLGMNVTGDSEQGEMTLQTSSSQGEML